MTLASLIKCMYIGIQVQPGRELAKGHPKTTAMARHTSLNQILFSVHFQPEGGSNSVNNDHHVEMKGEQNRE
jgi:hypothetical protein